MAKHIVFGAGPIGRAVSRRLVALGERVVLASRSGAGPEVPGAERFAVDASDSAAVAQLCERADTVVNCLNPQYHRWVSDWPPMAAALLAGAESSGALLVTVSNLYGYGPVAGPLVEDLPLCAPGSKGRVRARMFTDALQAHIAGRVRMVEVRASDYVGPGAQSHLGDRVVPKVLAGRSVSVVGSADQPHTWTYTEDVAALVVAVIGEPGSWGRAWHVPSNPPRTQRQAIGDLARLAGVPAPKVRTIPRIALQAAGVFSAMIRELRETDYQFSEPFVMDSAAATNAFGLSATGWDDVLSATLTSYGAEIASPARL